MTQLGVFLYVIRNLDNFVLSDPEQLVSDNGPQFISSEFERFMKENGTKHIKTSPYHSASNGEAERFVQTFKHSLKASKNDSGRPYLANILRSTSSVFSVIVVDIGTISNHLE